MKNHKLVYLIDKKQYAQGSRRLTEDQAYKFFVQFKVSEGEIDFERIKSEFETIKLLGISSKDLKGLTSNLKDVVDSVYSNMPRLRFRWYTNVEGSLYIFKTDGAYPNEVTKLNGHTFKDVLHSTKSNAVEYKELYDFYISNQELASIKPRPDFNVFFEAIYSKFLDDASYQLISLPELISDDVNTPCFKYVDKLNIRKGPTPAWDQFLNRVDYPEIFLAWIGAVFDPKNEGRQALWLQGNGFDGKSKVSNALKEIYGPKYTTAIGQEMGTFFYSTVYGKRFAVYGDCLNERLMSQTKIQGLTGADSVSVEYKGETPFMAKVYARLLICSNISPAVDFNKNNEKSRIIRLFVTKTAKGFDGDPDWEKKLVEEGPHLLHKAFEMYAKHAPKQTNITIPSDLWEKMETECGSDESSVVDEFVDLHLEPGEDNFAKKKEVIDALARFANSQDVPSHKINHLKNDLKQRFNKQGIKSARRIIAGKKASVYAGVKLKGVIS